MDNVFRIFFSVVFFLLGCFWAQAQQGIDFDRQLLKADSLLIESPIEAEKILLGIINDNSVPPIVKGKAHRLLATICTNHSRKADEIESLFQSSWFFKEAQASKEEGEAHRLIGQYYIQMKLVDEAQAYLSSALKLASQQGDTITVVKILSNQAQLAGLNNEPALRFKYYEEAIRLSEKVHYQQGLLVNWNKLSYAYWRTGQPEKMLACMKEAFKYKISNPDTLGVLYGDLGLAYMQVNRLDSADYYLQMGLGLIQAGNNVHQEIILTKFISELRQRQKRLPEALYYLQRKDSLAQSLFTVQLRREISYAESKYKDLESEAMIAEVINEERKLLVVIVAVTLLLAMLLFAVFRFRAKNRLIIKQKKDLDKVLGDLTERETLLRQLFDLSPSLILTHTLDGKIITFNRAVANSLQDENVDLVGKSILDIIPSWFTDQFSDFLTELQTKGESKGWMRLMKKDGSSRILRYHSLVIKLNQETPYVIGFALDDTDSYNARKEADQERKRLISVVENSPDYHSLLKPDGTITFVSRGIKHEVHELIGRNIRDFLPPDRYENYFEKLRQAYESKTSVQFEEVFGELSLRIRLVPMLFRGHVNEILVITTDITEAIKKQARERELTLKIELSERRYRNIVEESRVLICTHDLDGTLLTLNKPGANRLGYRPEELIGKNLRDLLPVEFYPEYEVYINQIRKEKAFEGFMTILTHDGSKLIFLFRNTLITEGNETYVLGSAQDVTEWRKADHREKKIKKELQIAKEEAEESNRLKTIFLGNLSHEVRTPLQGILGFAEILENPSLPEDKRLQFLNIIKTRATDMQNIIESLLDMASLETGEIKAYPVEVNMSEFMDNYFSKIKQTVDLGNKPINLQLKNEIEPQVTALVDPQHLVQVLSNLERNAIKFTNEGEILIKCYQVADTLQVDVSDTGIGIPMEKIVLIFKAFRQAHEGISRSKGGIGLGLSICKKMVELWGGNLIVKSEVGKGSIFSFTIPISQPSIQKRQ